MPEASSWLAGFKRERREQGRALRQYLLVEGEGGRVEARDVLAEEGPDHTKRQTGRAFVVHGHGVGEVVVELGVAAHPPRDAAGDLLDPPGHPPPEILVEGAYRPPDPRRLWDDVEGTPGPYLPHGQHRGLDRVHLPGDHGLQRRYYLGGHGDGVHRKVREGAVPAAAPDRHLEGVGGGHDRSRLRRRRPEREPRPQVQREDASDVVSHPLLYHHLPPAPTLFGWLEEELDRPVQPLAHPRKSVCRPYEHARVPVVAAGVHLAVYLRGKRQPRLLVYGQGVY